MANEGIYGQIFDQSRNRIGSNFQINNCTTSLQIAPSVATLSNDDFVVTWQSDGQDGDSYGIYGQIFDTLGDKVGSEFQANNHTTNDQRSSSVAALNNGNFAVTWYSGDQDGDNYGIYGQIFNALGVKVDGEFQINTHTTSCQWFQTIATLSNGSFVVTWGSNLQDGYGDGVYGQIFNESGAKIGSEFQINAHTNAHQSTPFVAALSNSNFIVMWQSYGQDGDDWGVYGQIFDDTGVKVGNEFQVNTYVTSYQGIPVVVALGSGFVVIWQSNGQDGDGFGVYGRIFQPNAIPIINKIVKSGKKNTVLKFKAKDFTDVFEDADGDSMFQILISTLPNNGNLKLSGAGSISEGQVIVADNIDNLVFDPNQDFVGIINFAWKGHDGLQYSDTSEDVTINIKDVDPNWLKLWWPVITGTATAVIGIPVAVISAVLVQKAKQKCKKKLDPDDFNIEIKLEGKK